MRQHPSTWAGGFNDAKPVMASCDQKRALAFDAFEVPAPDPG